MWERTVERGGSPWTGSSGAFLQQPAGDQSMEEKVWWAWRWTRDGTALQQSNCVLKHKSRHLDFLHISYQKHATRHRNIHINMMYELLTAAFHWPSNSIISILSPSSSCPTKLRPFVSKWCFSSGFTWNNKGWQFRTSFWGEKRFFFNDNSRLHIIFLNVFPKKKWSWNFIFITTSNLCLCLSST